MRIFLALILLTATTVMGREVVGRGCGEMTVDVGIAVVDAKTKEPVVGAKVTFYSKRDLIIRENIDLLRSRSGGQIPAAPKGVTSATDTSGKVRIKCCFSYSQAIYAADDKVDECYPDGVVEVEAPAFERMTVEAKELYPSAPYVGGLPDVTIELKKRANQALQHNDPSCHVSCLRTPRASWVRG